MAPRTSSDSVPPPPDPVLASEIDDLLGHELILSLLSRMLEEHRLPQGILFAGAPLLGKRTLSICLAKRLLSEGAAGWSPESSPGLRCDPNISRRISRNVHLDFMLLKPEKASKIVKIEQVRALQDWAWLSPGEGARKVALVFGADSISEEAANSFLKLLEEPPPSLTLILASDFPHRLLDTIRSRCTLFAFHPIPSRQLETWLCERRGIDPGRARLIVGLAEGRPGRALMMLGEDALPVREPLLEELAVLRRLGFLALPGAAARCLEQAGGLRPALEGLLILLRDGLILAGSHSDVARGDSHPMGSESPTVKVDSLQPGTALSPQGTKGKDWVLGSDLLDPLERALGGLPPSALLRGAEAVARGLDVTRHLWIPSEALVLENVLADVGIAFRSAPTAPASSPPLAPTAVVSAIR